MSKTRQEGVQVRREVMGDAFVDRALNNATEFSQPLQEFVNEHAWGGVWNREGLDRKTRSLITLAALTALKCPQELKGHVRGALNNGCTVEEIREALLHCAVYAGVPAAIDAFRAAQEVIDSYQQA
ncbi:MULTISPECIES: carboxymuconolactone decarboxylase family protein [Pseudomonadaceae]|jgi:4-carboxymuconolactone decarboxylase|uniref:carboxymuconolactone decarboxylase family protein n=1 Tax=Pseudomonadaceae TaxID=135621 RepID=UPI000C94A9FD|nr:MULTISPECIES: carboxymuconolactone decarboxylase family protein [Halopseudomonas]MAG99332.1 4-carboxymuconolactone decarboxylase [Pseudomonadales bacterium]HBT55944.1 4-carboxymuconolactone decarboxylase [Pseudomonas sp.]MDL2198636.1 carboxymuconolactone decarboxylase family protein [Halopseudomonas aestusnigri]UGV30683.1 carboxymuconolactone decarboxylase family protein [Halopseudomonas aestusnigri]BDX18075.1 4-carboxymuconolactone decarboxylase [Halopseudomonas aestusnigri]|tara:strand:- start:224 stop:601 length:378 start_codon:yes stop_codon:yes gene_type:complete